MLRILARPLKKTNKTAVNQKNHGQPPSLPTACQTHRRISEVPPGVLGVPGATAISAKIAAPVAFSSWPGLPLVHAQISETIRHGRGSNRHVRSMRTYQLLRYLRFIPTLMGCDRGLNGSHSADQAQPDRQFQNLEDAAPHHFSVAEGARQSVSVLPTPLTTMSSRPLLHSVPVQQKIPA